ncbi:FIST C-terminal domain-containing protein [Waterburya agarophytonicola K14]|uniref:FIST C-terminal domain-containing protein n=1 Tax=Waterburya agarophytonicola KI4 TaxID=2874699 RepID=A0A964FL37_9CYAN|nr:FIST N-terminal domain-containing protein [Waterburya agarophytonicola]MCC0179143.1 FIST C-terminal domain-containing protein [Waterburya agarophytonicola KI4]
MFKVVVGHSNDPDSVEAVAEVLEQCLESLAEITPQAGILFAAVDFEHSLILQEIYAQFPDLELIGGTTDGEISSVLDFQQDSLTLMLFCSDEIEFCAGVGTQASQDSLAAAQAAIKQATSKSKQKISLISLCITLPDGLTSSGVTIIKALKQELGSNLPIVGGLTADGGKYHKTYQFYNQEVLSDSIPIMLFSGDLLISCGVNSGWNPIGKKSTITKAEKNIIYEIDHQPALDFYQHYLGDLSPSIEYPLAVFEPDNKHFYMRAPISHDATQGSITFFGDLLQGAMVQMTEGNCDGILNSAELSMQEALNDYPGTHPDAALFFSCTARRQILSSRAEEEYKFAKKHFNAALPSCGFYTYGEIAPLESHGSTLFHNETFITLLLGTK